VLLESEDTTLWPVAADDQRVVVLALGLEATYYEVSLVNPRLEPLPLRPTFGTTRVSGDSVYWLRDHDLLRSGFGDAEPEALTRLGGESFAVGPGYFLSWEYDNAGSYNTFLQNEGAGCDRTFPATTVIGHDAALDAQYIYSANAFVTYTAQGEGVWSHELLRVDRETGASARLNTPSINFDGFVKLLGHDAENLYLSDGYTLVGIRKP